MANAIYPKWKTALMAATANSALNGSGSTGLFCSLIDTGVYTYSASHQFFTSLAGAIVGTDQEITSLTVGTVSDGTVDGADITYTGVSGASIEAIVLYRKNAGANTTWQLVAYMDTGVTGLPVTPNGGDITITWNASGIFTL